MESRTLNSRKRSEWSRNWEVGSWMRGLFWSVSLCVYVFPNNSYVCVQSNWHPFLTRSSLICHSFPFDLSDGNWIYKPLYRMFTHLNTLTVWTRKLNRLCIHVCMHVFDMYVNARKALERAHKISYLMVLDSFFWAFIYSSESQLNCLHSRAASCTSVCVCVWYVFVKIENEIHSRYMQPRDWNESKDREWIKVTRARCNGWMDWRNGIEMMTMMNAVRFHAYVNE